MDFKVKNVLTENFPYEVHQVRGPQGELIWVEKGVNPDNVFDDKRRSDWPFSQIIADLICQQIAEGSSLSQVCRQEGFPTYNILCRWRREHSDFNKDIKQAYEDRGEFYREKVLEEIRSLGPGADLAAVRAKIEAFKWAAETDSPRSDNKRKPNFILKTK